MLNPPFFLLLLISFGLVNFLIIQRQVFLTEFSVLYISSRLQVLEHRPPLLASFYVWNKDTLTKKLGFIRFGPAECWGAKSLSSFCSYTSGSQFFLGVYLMRCEHLQVLTVLCRTAEHVTECVYAAVKAEREP